MFSPTASPTIGTRTVFAPMSHENGRYSTVSAPIERLRTDVVPEATNTRSWFAPVTVRQPKIATHHHTSAQGTTVECFFFLCVFRHRKQCHKTYTSADADPPLHVVGPSFVRSMSPLRLVILFALAVCHMYHPCLQLQDSTTVMACAGCLQLCPSRIQSVHLLKSMSSARACLRPSLDSRTGRTQVRANRRGCLPLVGLLKPHMQVRCL